MLHPLYYILGQDAFKGSINEAFLTNNLDGDLDDAEPTVDIYDHALGVADTYDTSPGSALSNTQSAGDKLLIGFDCKLVRDMLANTHPSGFAFVKRTDMGAIGGTVGGDRWRKDFAEHWANIAAADTAVRAVITGAGDTPDPKGAFLCFGYEEAILGTPAVDAAFKTDLQTFIADLRADYLGAGGAIVLDLPPKTVSGYTAAQLTSLAAARKAIMEVAFADAFVSYVNTDDLARTASGVEYTGEATMLLGARMAAEMKRITVGKGSVTPTGFPVYILLGDEGAVGVVENSFISVESAGVFESGAIANSLIWNWSSQTWEALDGQTNSNTETDGLTKFGPDVAFVAEIIEKKHPNGAAIFKLGKNASALGNAAATGGSWNKSDGDNYTTALDEFKVALQAMFDTVDKIPDVRGIIWYQAEEDVATKALADAYLTNLTAHVANLRADFGTRTDADAARTTPVLIPQMLDTGFYTQDNVDAVRAAQQELTADDDYAVLIDGDDLTVHSDGVHLAGSAIHGMGQLLADAVAAL